MLCGEGSLLNRGFDELCDAIREKGVNISQNRLPISWKGEMANGRYEITGGKSSQFISGLMFALPLLCGDSEIVLTSPLQSSGYVDITIETLGKFGIQSGYRIKGNQQYISPGEIDVEGDWSNSAYFLCADVEVSGLCENSLQKDSIFSKVKDQDEIDVSEIPDLVPILAVYAATREKKVVFKNIERLRLKESDRVKSVSEMLISLGASVSSDESTMTIESSGLTGGEVDSFNDHRIVMSAAIASCYCKNEVVIKNAQAVNKSYPEFFNHFNKLGGCAYVI